MSDEYYGHPFEAESAEMRRRLAQYRKQRELIKKALEVKA